MKRTTASSVEPAMRCGAHCYVVAVGSNRRHPRHGAPRQVVSAGLAALDHAGLQLMRISRTIDSRPLGPSLRTYANAVALVASPDDPATMLVRLKAIEARFGRRRGGRRWGARVLDLDLVLWDGGPWSSPGLVIPHPAYRLRRFVLGPMRHWGPSARDPLSGLTPAHLHARLTRPRALPKPRP